VGFLLQKILLLVSSVFYLLFVSNLFVCCSCFKIEFYSSFLKFLISDTGEAQLLKPVEMSQVAECESPKVISLNPLRF